MNDAARRALPAADHVVPHADADGLAVGALALRRFGSRRDPARAGTDPLRAAPAVASRLDRRAGLWEAKHPGSRATRRIKIRA